MTSEVILCKSIDWPPRDKATRSFSKDFAAKLAEDIRVEGLLNPITVRPHPDKPGRYLGVAGEHRHHAVGHILKQESIEAKVYVDFDADDAKMARLAENLFRNPLKKAQHILVIQEWHALYERKYADRKIKGKAGRAQGGPLPAQATTADHNGPEATGPEPAPKPPTFPEVIADTTGKSLTTAKREARIARSFTPLQVEVFDQMGVGLVDMETIAKVGDQQQRDEIVNLIASGMEVDEAIVTVAKPVGGVIEKSNGAATDASTKADDADMDDATWLETWCGAKRKLIANQAAYNEQALLFRRLAQARQAFKVKAKKIIKDQKGVTRGCLSRLVNKLYWLAHPRDWPVCGSCAGQGTTTLGQCAECYGDGFKLKEDRR